MRVPSGCSKLDTNTIRDKVKGIVFGAILGDSLGIATEGLTLSEIKNVYAQGPIRFGMDEAGMPFHRDEFRSLFDENDFGSNSEQILLIMELLLESSSHFSPKSFAYKLKSYYNHGIKNTNRQPATYMNNMNKAVLTHPMYDINPQQAALDVWKSNHDLKGLNDAIVRAPLLGALKFWDGTTVVENTTECCRVTHPDPHCMISCVIMSTLIARLLRGQGSETNNQTISSSPENTKQPNFFIDSLPVNEILQTLVKNVIETNKSIFMSPQTDPLFFVQETELKQVETYYGELLNSCRTPSLESLQLDQCQTASFECLRAALFSFVRDVPAGAEPEYFKKMMMDIVMQGGEASTNACISGALLGARFGYSQLPTEWVVGLKRWEWLEDKLDEFCSLL